MTPQHEHSEDPPVDAASAVDDDVREDETPEQARQRRENVRVSVQLPITVQIDGREPVSGRSRDLSATGVGFATRLPIEVGDTGTVSVQFEGLEFTKRFVVRFMKLILAGRQIGAQFDDLSHDEREKLVKEVFAIQREQLRNQQRLA